MSNMSRPSLKTNWFGPMLALLTSLCCSQAFLTDEIAVPMKSFQLGCAPDRVVKQVTKNVSVRCAHIGHIHTKYDSIMSIRLLKKFPKASKWELVAEQRDINDQPKAVHNVLAAGRLDRDVFDSFLEITWPVAVEDTFGSYRCDVIGFQRDSALITTEVTPQIEVLEDDVTATDMRILFRKLNEDLSDVETDVALTGDDIEDFSKQYNSLTNESEIQGEHLTTLQNRIDSLDKPIEYANTEIEAIQGNIGHLEQKMDSLNNTVSIVTGKVPPLEGKVTSIKDSTDSLQVKLYSVGEDIKELETETTTLHADLQTLTSACDALASEVSSTKVSLDTVAKDTESSTTETTSLTKEIQRIKNEMLSVDETVKRFYDQINSFTDSMNAFKSSYDLVDDLQSWPRGNFALLRPKTGCPVDFTFSRGKDTYLQIHTESSKGSNDDSHSHVLAHWTKSKDGSNNFLTLWFCEANGVFNTGSWPRGSYCMNELKGMPCPDGFSTGSIAFHMEESRTVEDFTSGSVHDGNLLQFCCRDDGVYSKPVTLPTHSPFLLYRHGGHCQRVQGMDVSEEFIIIDTEDTDNKDVVTDPAPDVDVPPNSPMKMHLCHYTKS